MLGPGGVGGFVAAALARAGARRGGDRPRADGGADRRATVSQVTQPGAGADFTAHPQAAAELVGASRLPAGGDQGRPGWRRRWSGSGRDPGLVVPLLNGLDHLEVLRAALGRRARRRRGDPDRVRPAGARRDRADQPGGCRVDLAAEDPALETAARRAGGAAPGCRPRRPAIGGSERQVLWSKLARLNALALTTSASDRPIGFVRTDPRWRSALEGAVNETVAVANADGAHLDPADTLAELDQAHAELGSSMQRDIAAGREPELDAIAGAVLRAGARHGLRCPTVHWLADRVRRSGAELARGRRAPSGSLVGGR